MPEFDATFARDFADRVHAGQLYGSVPYRVHLEAVERVLADFGYTGPFWVACAWLHDAIEDTAVTREAIEIVFDAAVADAVWRVTGEGSRRPERAASIRLKIIPDRDAAILKTADRIANVEACATDPLGRGRMYLSEFRKFRRAVEHHLTPAMLNRLDAAHRRVTAVTNSALAEALPERPAAAAKAGQAEAARIGPAGGASPLRQRR